MYIPLQQPDVYLESISHRGYFLQQEIELQFWESREIELMSDPEKPELARFRHPFISSFFSKFDPISARFVPNRSVAPVQFILKTRKIRKF